MERIPLNSWRTHAGHVERYQYAAENIKHGELVNDIACGIGYGSEFLKHATYTGYDKPGIYHTGFSGTFFPCDLDDENFRPFLGDVTICFETLEHVRNPIGLARLIGDATLRAVFVSVPTAPTKHVNFYHLHDFTVEDIPPMFSGFSVRECWEQPSELSHVWYLERDHEHVG